MLEAPGTAEKLAAFLRRSGDRCVERWIDRVRATPWGDAFDREQIRDNHPALIDAMIVRAEGRDEGPEEIRAIARMHASQRASMGYALEQLLWENALFRRTLLEQLDDEDVLLGRREKTLLHESLDLAAVESSHFFSLEASETDLQLRQAAEAARDRAEEILGRITEGFFALDPNYRFTYLNPAGERFLGRSLAEVVGTPVWDAFPGSEDSPIGAAYRQAMTSGEPVAEVLYYPPWGRWFDVRAFPSRTGLSVYFRDETERILRDRERERVLEIVEHGDAVFVTDREFRIVFVNGTQERLAGVPREKTLGRNLWEAFPEITDPKLRFWREYHRVMNERVPVQFDEYFAPTDIWVGVTAYPTREGGIAGFFRDVTDRKDVEFAQERLVGVVGHDLRNPLTAVRVGIQRVASREEVPQQLRTTLRRTLRSIDKMDRMITDLLDYSRVQSGGGIAVTRRPIDLGALLRAIHGEFDESHPGRVHLELAAELRGDWDADRLEQVFSNLVSNALRHGDPTAPVTVTATADDGTVRVEVHNEGQPIPRDAHSTIFRAFQSGGGGLGLGLYIACNIVSQHGGSITVDSAEGRGTTFTVTLPRA